VAARTAIGLDIGTSGVRAAELTFGRHGVRLEKFGQVAVPAGAVRDGEVVEPTSVAEAIKELWGATRFSSKNVVLGVANQRVVVRNVELPWLPVAELRKSLGLQVADLLPMPVEQAVLDFHPLEEVRGDRGRMVRGLLVAAARDTVLANVRCAERAGLVPTSVDLTSFAVLRSLGAGAFGDGATEALVDVGSRVTNIVVHTAGVPRFVRILLMGGQDITDALAERVGSSLAEAEGLKHMVGMDGTAGPQFTNAARAVDATAQSLVDEIRGSLDYYSSTTPGAPVDRVVLAGGGSLLRGLTDRLAQAVRVPVHVGDPMKDMSIGRTGLDDDQLALVRPLAAVPVGLAMGAAR
jgi:type IV pilus assembly protein PilM